MVKDHYTRSKPAGHIQGFNATSAKTQFLPLCSCTDVVLVMIVFVGGIYHAFNLGGAERQRSTNRKLASPKQDSPSIFKDER